ITLTENAVLGDEGYNLNITETGITVEAKTPVGFYYALLTVQKMMPSHVLAGVRATGAVDYAIPCVQIQDEPRFSYRSFMLDCSRHFFEVSEIKRMLDVMAIYKMNTFHWHLTDDQGWRAEIKSFPKLTTVGATAPDCRITDFENGTYWLGHPYGPYFYSQDDMREIVRYAAERHIEVIPEIEMLGHSVAALVAYPEFSCDPSAKRQVWSNGGISNDVVNVANPEAVKFYEKIVDELCEIFPGRYFHIGGDECPTTAWEKNALCQQFLQDQGFTSYRQIQSWFTNHITGYLAAKGKRTIVWNESITAGGSDLNMVKEHNPIIMCWYPAQGGATKAAEIGLDAIITEYHGSAASASGAGGYYINRKLSNHPSELDGAGAGDDTVEGCYKYVPVQGGQTNVIGVQGTFWTEWVGVSEYLEYLALPRLFCVAEAGWTPEARKDWDRFVDHMVIDTQILDYGNYTYSQHWMPGYVPPKIETVDIIADGITEYQFTNQSKDRPAALADNNGTLNGQAAACTSFVLEPAEKENTYYIKSVESGKYLYASAGASGTVVTLSASKVAWSFDFTTMPKYVAICLASQPDMALNNNVTNATKVRLFAHGTSNGASFYEMKITKAAPEPTAIEAVEAAPKQAPTLFFDINGRPAAGNAKGVLISNGVKVLRK
ncbi:MAG: beta-N-acetylhexosaminidase, partial [Bacteroidales bacterium]|nr:beta-N-acetylhexosaminidase [Candidatus Physcousia equi]